MLQHFLPEQIVHRNFQHKHLKTAKSTDNCNPQSSPSLNFLFNHTHVLNVDMPMFIYIESRLRIEEKTK
jgi:hypothetical protein